MEKKMHCTGLWCTMNRDFNTEDCKLYDKCPQYTPKKDFTRLDAVIEIAEKEFNITDDKQKEKLRILFNAYVSAYMSLFCTL